MKLVSVIIPAFNCGESIVPTVNSILSSGLTDYEIIIVNDGSTDNTAKTCKELCSKYSFIKYSEQKNSGVSVARNKGLSLAEGDYVMFFDSDDTAQEDGFSECVDIIQEQQPDMLVFGMSFDYYKNGKCYRKEKLVPKQEGLLNKKQITENLEGLYATNALTSACNKLYRKKLLVDNSILFNTSYFLMEDFLFSLESLKVCENIYCLQKALYQYKQAENEKNAFNRLNRIADLCEYAVPFKNALEALGAGKAADNVFNNFFFMLLSQKMYYLNKKEIRELTEILKTSPLFNEIKQDEIPPAYWGFLKNIKNARYSKIRLLNLKTQARHKVAVLVKSIINR